VLDECREQAETLPDVDDGRHDLTLLLREKAEDRPLVELDVEFRTHV